MLLSGSVSLTIVAVKSSHATLSLIHTEYPLNESSAENEPDFPSITFSSVGSKAAVAAPPTIMTTPIIVIIPPMINNTLPAVCMVWLRTGRIYTCGRKLQENYSSFVSSSVPPVDGNEYGSTTVSLGVD